MSSYQNQLPDDLFDWSCKILNSALLAAAKVGNRHIINSLIKYGANNFQECIDSTHQNNHISAFAYLCKSVINEDMTAIDILLARNDESVEHLPRYQELLIYRIILGPLLQNGKISLATLIQVALSAGKLSIAGQIIRHSSHHPSSGFIDWHDLELTFVDPTWLMDVTNLYYIGLSANKLRAIPDFILQYRSLQKLQIHHNKISYLPGELLQLPCIQEIDVSFNTIVSIPEIIRQRVSASLECLNLSNNKLEDLPSYFSGSNIKSLDMSFNRLSSVPSCVVHLRRLHTLNLSSNVGIEIIPCELGNLKHLVLLGLDGLPYLKNIPSKDKSTSLEFLRSRARGLQTLSHYDVLVVGTTNNKCLEILSNCVQNESKRRFFSYLKFINTSQFLHFHQTFALPCSVYVLVWDCQSQQSSDELLHLILHLVTYAPNSSIVIAACWFEAITPNHNQWVEKQLENCLWKEFVDQVNLVVITLDKEALGGQRNTVQHLLDTIDRHGKRHSFKAAVPNSYLVLTDYIQMESKRLLEDKKPPLLSEWDIWELVRSSPHHDLSGHKELSLVVSFLSSVSSLLLLQTNRSDERNYYVLNRQWFLDAMSGLLRLHQNQKVATALYPSEFLYDLLNCPTLQGTLPYVIYLLVYQLGLAIPVTSHELLIPVMLSGGHVDDFVLQYNVKRTYTFRSTPVAFWPHLIAHLLINMKYLLTILTLDRTGEPLTKMLQDMLPEDMGNWNYWRTGMITWMCGSQLVYSIEAIDPFVSSSGVYREGLEIRVAHTEIGIKAMTVLTATVNTLLTNWYSDLWMTTEILTSCPQCTALLSIEECTQSLCNEADIICKGQGCRLKPLDLIPDLYRSNVANDLKFLCSSKIDVNFQEKSSCLSLAPSLTVFRGEFGTLPVAVKPFPSPYSKPKSFPFLDFWNELSMLQYITTQRTSPFLIEPLAATAQPLTLMYPLATFCSLEEVVLESNITLLPLLRIRIVYQLASALEVLHSIKIIHRNVCLANILVFSLSLDDQINIKLSGFSTSCLELNHGVAIGEYGTFPAPEMDKLNYEYDQRIDVFSFAFTSYEILLRKKLKCRRGVRFQTALVNLDRPKLQPLSKLVPYFTPLLEKCWDSEPTKRPFFLEIVAHFQRPLHVLAREGVCVNELNEFNAIATRYIRQSNGTYSCNIYVCSSILCAKDTTVLSYVSIPGLEVQQTISLPCQYIICMCCSTDYLWVSFQHKFVRVYSATTLEFIKEIQFDSHVLVMAVSPDCIYLGKEDGEIHLYNLSQPSPLHCPTKTHVISYQQPIRSLQVIQDSIVCCTKRSCIRIHPQTLLVEQEFPVISETEIKSAVIAVDVKNDVEYLWVGLRRNQQIVVFDAIAGRGLYGINCHTILKMDKSEVWVTCLLIVLDTVWVGLNTGHILSFYAFSTEPLLLTYLKVHTDNVRSMCLLQPSYWGPKTIYQFQDNSDSSDSSDSEDIEVESILSQSLRNSMTNISMPRVASVLSCGQGIDKKIPRISEDGVVITTHNNDTSGLQVIRLDGPDSTCAKKIEYQSHRTARPYMGMEINNTSWELTDSITDTHQQLPELDESLNMSYDSDLHSYYCISMDDVTHNSPLKEKTTSFHDDNHHGNKNAMSDSDSEGSEGYLEMGSAPVDRRSTLSSTGSIGLVKKAKQERDQVLKSGIFPS